MGFFHTAVAFFLKELRLQRFGKVFFYHISFKDRVLWVCIFLGLLLSCACVAVPKIYLHFHIPKN
jgi:hypothetical protein